MSDQPLVTIDVVADHFSVSISTIRKWLRENRIPKSTYMKIGSTYRFDLANMTNAMLGGGGEPNPQIELDFEEPDESDNEEADSNQIKLY